MTTQQWLNRAYNIEKERQAIKEEMQKALSEITGLQSPQLGDKVQSSPINSAEIKYCAYADYVSDLHKRLTELMEVKQEIFEAINKVEDSLLRELLERRYLKFEKWFQIAAAMNYSIDHVQGNMHRKALKEVSQFIKR